MDQVYHPFYDENERLDSFKRSWPFSDEFACNPKAMAEAGWYSCGTEEAPDAAKCFFCDKEMDGWEEDDDPWLEHKKHSSKCLFVVIGKKQAELTVYEHLDLNCHLDKKKLQEVFDAQMNEFFKKGEQFFKERFPNHKVPDLFTKKGKK